MCDDRVLWKWRRLWGKRQVKEKSLPWQSLWKSAMERMSRWCGLIGKVQHVQKLEQPWKSLSWKECQDDETRWQSAIRPQVWATLEKPDGNDMRIWQCPDGAITRSDHLSDPRTACHRKDANMAAVGGPDGEIKSSGRHWSSPSWKICQNGHVRMTERQDQTV